MSLRWSFSVGQLFDVLLPAAVALAVLCSTWVLADARRRGLKRYALGAWTLGTLLLPFTVLPLYLLARLWQRTPPRSDTSATDTTDADDPAAEADSDGAVAPAPTQAEGEVATAQTRALTTRLRAVGARHAPTLIYAVVLTTLAALFFAHYYRNLDAHLARASAAKLHNQHERAAREYRAALHLTDDPHTHKLLGLELAAAQQWAEALTELRVAARGGEPDAALPYHIAIALDALGRSDEATAEYRNFLAGELCAQLPPDVRCLRADARARAGVNGPAF